MEPPPFGDAVAAIDAGDVPALERLLAAHPALARERDDGYDGGEHYFARPYLLWYVAENPVRRGTLPGNIPDVARAIVRAAERAGALPPQVGYALGLVCSGRVPRECGVQRALIDVLVDAGADPGGAVTAALAHRELDAAERLLERGAARTLLVAACTGRVDEVARLAPGAGDDERRAALAAAARYGDAPAVAVLLALGVDASAYAPPGFHDHATPLHHAVDGGSLDAVRALVEAGAPLGARDRVYDGTPLGWAEHLGRGEIAAYLRGREGGVKSLGSASPVPPAVGPDPRVARGGA